jgi:hypothetical protein
MDKNRQKDIEDLMELLEAGSEVCGNLLKIAK